MSAPPANGSGRKYTLTKAWLAIGTGMMLVSAALAAVGKLTADWTSLATAFFGTSSLLVTGFNAANAYITGKTAGTEGGGS